LNPPKLYKLSNQVEFWYNEWNKCSTQVLIAGFTCWKQIEQLQTYQLGRNKAKAVFRDS